MHPEICKIGPLTIYSYGLMLIIAFFTATILAMLQAKKEDTSPEAIFNLNFTIFIFGIIGARLLYVIGHLDFYWHNPWDIVMLQKGGLSWFGGLILGALSGYIYLKRHKFSILKILDLVIPYVALAQGIGRIGCFLNGCCYGKASKFGIYFPVHDAVLLPTQLFSSLALVAIFVVLKLLQDKPHERGLIFFLYLILYAVKRFTIEFYRADNPPIIFGLTLFHLMSISLFFFGLAGLFWVTRKNEAPRAKA